MDSKININTRFIQLEKEAILKELDSNEIGLSEKEALIRLKRYGLNEVLLKKKSVLNIFLRQFKSSLIILMIIASILSFVFGSISDSLTITIILFVNTVLGFFQEYKSEKSSQKLLNLITTSAEVRRDDKELEIDRKEVVVGDILILKQGDIVSADARIIKSNDFQVDESSLTGENLPIAKTDKLDPEGKYLLKSKNFIFSGTTVAHGYAEAVVHSIGKDTEMGEIASVTSQTQKVSRYEKNILEFSKFLIEIVFFSLTILFFLKLLFHSTNFNLIEFILFIIALTVATVPEALPVITTLTMSAGALKLSEKSVVVKRLSTLEDFGNIEILCTDKTGTLTENVLKIKDTFSLNDKLFYELSKYVIETPSLKRKRTSHSFDESIANYIKEKVTKSYSFKKLNLEPFDPILKRKSIEMLNDEGENIRIFMGAPEGLIQLSNLEEERKKELINKITVLGDQGLRTLGVSYEIDNKNEFLGFYIFEDPIKRSTYYAIRTAKILGIQIKILTGDSVEVAKYVGIKVGLINEEDKVISGEEMDQMSDEEFRRVVNSTHIFARVNPKQKYKIIKTLQEKYTVAYQGDGINDAPSLKLADVAIAVNSATDVAKDASDIILLKNDLSVVIDGVKYGRKVFVNINKYIKHTMAGNFGSFFVLLIIEFFSTSLPLLPIQLLLSNLMSDLPLIFISTDDVDDEDLKKPEEFNIGRVFGLSIGLGGLLTFFTLVFIFINQSASREVMQTLLFMFLNITSLIIIFSVRVKDWFFKGNPPSKLLIYSIILFILLTIILPFTGLREVFHFVPVGVTYLIETITISLIYFISLDFAKRRFEKLWSRVKEIK